MKAEYNFSRAERGKFYRAGAQLNLPVYLDAKALEFVTAIALKRKKDPSTIVNELVHRDIRQSRAPK